MLQHYKQAATLCNQHQSFQSRNIKAFALKYIGQYYTQKGDIQRALTYLKQAEIIIQNKGFETSSLQSTIPLELGIAYLVREDSSLALQYFQQGLSHKSISPGNQALLYDRMGETYMEMGRYSEAIIYQDKAIQIYNKLEWYEEVLVVQAQKAKVYTKMGLYEKARDFLESIFTRFKEFGEEGKSRGLGKIHLIAGDTYFLLENYPVALAHYQQALWAVVEDSLSSDPFVNPSIDMLYAENVFQDGLNGKGKSFLASYKKTGKEEELQAAFSAFTLAMIVDDSLRKEYSKTSSKSLIATETHWRTDLALQTLSLLEKENSATVDTAFALIEHSRAMDLYSRLIEAHAQAYMEEEIPQGLQDILNETKLALADCQSFWEGKNKLLTDSACAKLRLQLDSLHQILEKNYPIYRLKQFQIDLQNLPSIQAKLSANEGLIEYFWGEEILYGLLVTKETAYWKALAKTDEINALLKELDFNQTNQDYLLAARLYDLYVALLAPFGNLPEKLILVPDNALHLLPFEALLTQKPDSLSMIKTGSNFWKGSNQIHEGASYVLQQYKIQYAHSANLLFTTHSTVSDRKGLAAFAPSYSSGDYFRNSPILPLNGNTEHAKRLVNLMGGKSFTGSEADSASFIREAANYPFLHLALHGYSNENNPILSALAFSSTPNSKGIVYAANLYGLPPLQAELVSLLSCETGAGQYAKGEGIMSLARAFRYAGAKSVLMSLWQADTGPGIEIMENFYQYLYEGDNKSLAIQKAKLDWLSNADAIGAHPSKWANFVLIGDGSPISKKTTKWPYIVIGVLILAVALIWKYRRIRVQN
ncbi:MAG: CHAT domain-containing protein [Bacteroidetes bacterium]|nr:CHAT domain-containing protein [Bacteroidota bacterium]